jgi:threonine/homoserine/homoserine lactone efflux protein
MNDPGLFTLMVLAILAIPGPTNTLLAISGGSVGMRYSLWLVPAELAGYLAAILLIGLVAGPWLAHPPWSHAVRVVIALYLVVLAIRLWRVHDSQADARSHISPRDVLITTFLNPKAAVFATIVIPFGQKGWQWYVLGFALIVTIMSLSWLTVGGAFARGGPMSRYHPLVFSAGSVILAIFAAIIIFPVVRLISAS